MEQSEKETIHLIDVYKSKPILGNPKYGDYLKKYSKDDAWKLIAADVTEKSAEDCKKKMVCLLASFRRKKSKVIF